ncbi:hypothetical protein HII31_10259 [Pseudocercospora fuligena]|uniref:Uncharacterized protein n=1 Tax=Pseudocercospora fuligena TaxID=685502 RepID=A0A8H6RDF1_9PEZI|nr:hypothetical protein HII31_10259 [Pseudocercospora fuligena]
MMNEETSLSQEEVNQEINMSDADTMQGETDLSDSQHNNAATGSNTADNMTPPGGIIPQDETYTLPDFLFYGSFLNYQQILSIPFADIPLADIDDIMRTAAQYTVDDIVQHVNRNNVEDATVVLTAKIVEDLIKRSIKRLAKSRATTIDKVKKEFEAKQKENGIVKGKYTNHRANHADPAAIYHPSGVDGGF